MSERLKIPAKLDAVFIHGQGYRNRTHMDPTPSTYGRLEISAAKKLLDASIEIDHFVFSGFAFPRQQIPLAQVDADFLRSRTGFPKNRVIADDTARTTSMEMALSQQKAEEKNWKEIMHLTVKDHTDEVAIHVKRVFPKDTHVTVIATEDILTKPLDIPQSAEQLKRDERHRKRYKKFLDKFRWSKQAFVLKTYQAIKYPFIHLPYGTKLLEKISKRYRPDIS